MSKARARDVMKDLGLTGREDEGPGCGETHEAEFYHQDDIEDARAAVPIRKTGGDNRYE